jgi:hypothetical protein
MAKMRVNRLTDLPQRACGRFFLPKLVTAPGPMKTANPNSSADRAKPRTPGTTHGSNVATPVTAQASASGTPEAHLARTGRHRNGDRMMPIPMITHPPEIAAALIPASRTEATMKVRYTIYPVAKSP